MPAEEVPSTELSPDTQQANLLVAPIVLTNEQREFYGDSFTLHEQLLRCNGFGLDQPEGVLGHAIRFTPEEASGLIEVMGNWLPTQLHLLDLETSIARSRVNQKKEGVVNHRFEQIWGHKPSAEEIQSRGIIIEFGGPTDATSYNSAVSNYGVNPSIVTNISAHMGAIDMFADAQNMPILDSSIGTVFISGLPGAKGRMSDRHTEVRPAAIRESARVIKPGGFLLWRAGTTDDYENIIQQGLMPEHLEVAYSFTEESHSGIVTVPRIHVNGVYRKPEP